MNEVVKEQNEPKQKEKVTKKKVKDNFKSQFEDRIAKGLDFYNDLLKEYMDKKAIIVEKVGVKEEKKEEEKEVDRLTVPVRSRRMTSQEVVEEIVRIEGPRKEGTLTVEQEAKINDLEANLDLSEFNLTSECVIEMTDAAKKWFQKHKKKQLHYCERVIARLKILSTGRFSYTLCKRLKTKSQNLTLYESKIDSGSRIIWEFANAYSERRSSSGKHFCEQ